MLLFLLPTFLNIRRAPRHHPNPHMQWQLVHRSHRLEPASAESPGSQKRNLRTPVKKKDGHKVSQRQLSSWQAIPSPIQPHPNIQSLAVGVWGSALSHISRLPLWHLVTPATAAWRLELESGVLPNRTVAAWAQERPVEFSLQTSLAVEEGSKCLIETVGLLRNRSKC